MIISIFDIETLPNQNIPEGCRPQFDPNDVKVGNMKNPAKISAKIEEEKKSFEADLVKKMSVTPSLSQLCTFCGMKYDTELDNILSETTIQITKEDDADDLDGVIGGWEFLQKMYLERTPIVSFNGTGFDFPVMWHRAIIQDVPVDRNMYDRLTPRYGGKFHYDLLGLLAGWTLDKMKGHSLDFFLQLYGLGEKGEMDGSQVYDAWQQEEYEKIKEYCRQDVLKTCKLFKRVSPWLLIEKEDV